MSRVGCYARFSSEKQSDTSIDDQVRRCRDWPKYGPLVADALVFADYAVSGASLARSGFDALMGKVRAREIDVLLVESVDRLSRDQADGHAVFRDFSFYGVRLIAIADGIDTDSKGAKITFSAKQMVAAIYLDDLSDKTKRGMAGRAHAGLATGGKLFGYATKMQGDPRKPSGSKITIDADQAKIVLRIFALYLAGRSAKEIARQLNADGVPAPRASAGTRHRLRPAWANSTVSAILKNERYAGTWRFGERVWIKTPGTGKRVSRPAPPDAVITQERHDLVIIDRATWDAVAARRAEVYNTFAGSADNPKGRAVSGRRDRHPLSGLFYCTCSAPFTVSRGGSADYLACADSKRGRCAIRKSLREDIAIARMTDALREKLADSAGVSYVRKRIAERLGEVANGRDRQVNEVRNRIGRTQCRLANLVELMAEGDKSATVRDAVRDLEAQLDVDRAALKAVESIAREPLHLPSVAEVLEQVFEVLTAVREDPTAARERLARWFRDGRITLELGDDGVYVGKSELLPLVLFAKRQEAEPGLGVPPLSTMVAGAAFAKRLAIEGSTPL